MVIRLKKNDIRSRLGYCKSVLGGTYHYETVARCYHWLGDKDQARYWFLQTAASITEIVDSGKMGNLFNNGCKYLASANMFLKAGAVEPALSLLKLGVKVLREYLQGNPGRADAWGYLAECHFLLEEYQEVFKDLEKLHKVHPHKYQRFDGLALLIKAKLERDKGAALEALALFGSEIRETGLRPYQEGDTFSLWDRFEYGIEILKELDAQGADEYIKYC